MLKLGLERNEEAGLPHFTLYHKVRITGGDIKEEIGTVLVHRPCDSPGKSSNDV